MSGWWPLGSWGWNERVWWSCRWTKRPVEETGVGSKSVKSWNSSSRLGKLRACCGPGCWGWPLVKLWRDLSDDDLIEYWCWKWWYWCGMNIRFWGQGSELLKRKKRQRISYAITVTCMRAAQIRNWCWAEIRVSLRTICVMARERDLPLFRISTTAELSERMSMVCLDHLCSQRIAAIITGYISCRVDEGEFVNCTRLLNSSGHLKANHRPLRNLPKPMEGAASVYIWMSSCCVRLSW